MTALVIVAGGLGSRLSPYTDNIPKFLVNIGKNTGYVEIVRYWERQLDLQRVDSLTVIVHSAYTALVGEYHKLYFPNIPLIIKTVDEARGSAHAILTTCEHLRNKSVMFTWCDVLPVDSIPIEQLCENGTGKNIVFTNYKNSCRYGLVLTPDGVKPRLDSNERGGCFGLYYIHRFRTDAEYKDGQDFIEIIEQYGTMFEHEIENIIDFGDLPKLRRTQAKADEAREFNSIEFIGDFVLKQALNEQGRRILEKEVAWYKRLDELVDSHHSRPAVPRTWIASDGSGFFMSRVKGVPIWKAWHGLSPVDRAHVLNQLIEQRRMLFNLDRQLVVSTHALRDVRKEALTKLLDRYHEIHGVIQAFGEVRSVNGWLLHETNPETMIRELYNRIEEYYKRNPIQEYGFIHGDLQFSNSMVDLDTMRVTIIDPRGYFGYSSLLGLEDYDIGKLLYALSGYDNFNSTREFFITLEGGHLNFDIPRPSHDGVEEILRTQFSSIHQAWLAVCWIGLAQYIKNDPLKSVAAHYHGMMLADQLSRTL